MTSKERAVLKSIASSLDTVIIVGKGGITENVVSETLNALRTRELIKGRVLESSLLTAKEACEELASATGAEAVQSIGSKFVLYKENPDLPLEKRVNLKSK